MFRLVLALVASPLYFAAARKAVERSKRRGTTEEVRHQEFCAQGGTSPLMAILAIAVSFSLPVIMLMAS